MLIFASFDYNAQTEKTLWKLSLPVKLLYSLELLYSNILHLGGWVRVLSAGLEPEETCQVENGFLATCNDACVVLLVTLVMLS